MPGIMPKLFKRKDTRDLLPSDFDVPRYDAVRALNGRGERCEVWGDDALRYFGIPVEPAHPNLLCPIVGHSMLAPARLMAEGWTFIKQPTPEILGLIPDPFLNPTFLIRIPSETPFDGVVQTIEARNLSVADTTTHVNPLVCLIPGEMLRYRFSNGPYKNMPTLPSFITGLMSRYVTLPDGFERSRASTLASLRQFYEGDHIPGIKEKKFERNMPTRFRQLHRDMVKISDWGQFMTKEAQDKYAAIYEKHVNGGVKKYLDVSSW